MQPPDAVDDLHTGRPPRAVRTRATRTPVAVGVDIGGTKIATGLIAADGSAGGHLRVPTPATAAGVLDAITTLVRGLDGHEGLPVGCGFPGMVAIDGTVVGGPNVALADVPLADELSVALGVPVTVENDAAAAAWGEFRAGAGTGASRSLAMLTLGTGVGCGLVLDGRLYRGAHGFAAELGRLIIRAGGRVGPGGIAGEVEAYCSGTGLRSLAADAVSDGRADDGSPLADVRTLTADVIARAARAGDRLALQLMADMADDLGTVLANLVNLLDVEAIVVGGGLGGAGDLFLDRARQAMRDHTMGLRRRPAVPVLPAALGSRAGLVGAALLAVQGAAAPR